MTDNKDKPLFGRPWIFIRGVPSMKFLPPEGPAEVAFAGAPVEPVAGVFAKAQAAAEGFDLLPFTARDGGVEAVAGSRQAGVGELAPGGQVLGLISQLRERGGQGLGGGVGFAVGPGALGQMGGEGELGGAGWGFKGEAGAEPEHRAALANVRNLSGTRNGPIAFTIRR